MGALAIREIKASTVLRVYKAIHNEAPSTARKVKAPISQICSYAVMNDLIGHGFKSRPPTKPRCSAARRRRHSTIAISWGVWLSRRPPSAVTVTMSSMRTPNRPGR